MADPNDKRAPHLTDKALAAKRERERREAEALRANLRRRKAADTAAENKKDEPGHG